MPRTNVHCLTPLPPKRPVDVKRGKVNMSTMFQTKQALLVTVVAAEASPTVSAVVAVVFADSGVAAGSSAACLAAF